MLMRFLVTFLLSSPSSQECEAAGEHLGPQRTAFILNTGVPKLFDVAVMRLGDGTIQTQTESD